MAATLLLGSASPVHGGECYTLQVLAVNGTVQGYHYCVQAQGTLELRTRDRRSCGDTSLTASPGDTVHVFARGFDRGSAELPAGGGVVRVELAPTKDSCVVHASFAGSERPVDLEIKHVFRTSPDNDGLGILDVYEQPALGEPVSIPTPRGMRTLVFVEYEGPGGFVTPVVFVASARREVRLELNRLRRLPVRLPLSGAPHDLRDSHVVPDLLAPPPWSKERMDGLIMLIGPGMGQLWEEGDALLTGSLADIRYHLFADFGDFAVYRTIEAGHDEVDLHRPFERKAIRRIPRIGGRPAPPGTALAPGRIHVDVFQRLEEGHFTLQVGEAARWQTTASLPAADWLTAFHPEHGLAFLRWEEAEVLEGRWEPGSIRVVPAPGSRGRTTVSIQPLLEGTGAVLVGGVAASWSVTADEGQDVRLRGVPAGYYELRIEQGAQERGTTSRRVRLLPGEPELRVVLAER